MSIKPLIRRLPKAIRRELERKILEYDYSTFADLCAWLESQGHKISVPVIHKFKQELTSQWALIEWINRLNRPGQMETQELERESGFIDMLLARLGGRKAENQAELARRYFGEGYGDGR
jgi:hypothetical protein